MRDRSVCFFSWDISGWTFEEKTHRSYYSRRLLLAFYLYSSLTSYAFSFNITDLSDCRISDFGQYKEQLIDDTHSCDLKYLYHICSWKKSPKLYFERHSLTALPSHFLWNCYNLTDLFLSGNKIKKIAKDAFDELTSLVWLDLSKNQIKKLHEDTFKPLTELEFLFLQQNHIQVIDSNLFSQNAKISQLSLNDNDLRIIGDGAFRMSPTLNTLDLFNNRRLKRIDLTNISRGGSILYDLSVNLNNCSLKNLFIPMNVVELGVHRNHITSIDAHPNNRLKILNLDNNHLSTLRHLKLPYLTSLLIGENPIPISDSYGFKQLRYLHFHLNSKQNINITEIVKNLPLLQHVVITSPDMTTEQQTRIINDFKQYNVYCYIDKCFYCYDTK